MLCECVVQQNVDIMLVLTVVFFSLIWSFIRTKQTQPVKLKKN